LDFSLSEEQRLFQDGLDTSLKELSSLKRIRAQAETPGEIQEALWQAICALGLSATLVPEAFGGLGLGMLDAALIAEKLGKYAVPLPFIGPTVLTPIALDIAGSDKQKADYLPHVADGSLRISVAISEQVSGARKEGNVECRNSKLFGHALFVIDHVGAHKFLIADKSGDLHLLDATTSGLEIITLETIDRTRTTAMLVLDGAETEPLAVSPRDALVRMSNAAHLILAADLLGAADKMLHDAIEYAKVRVQFGRPIGSFQAVKHMCAEMAAELEPGRALLWYASHALDKNLPDATLACIHAKAYLAEAARLVARSAIEVHGGMGITEDLGLHFWFKRIGWSYQAFGSPTRLREEAAAVQNFAFATTRDSADFETHANL
jgi:alkylation response protein AidB-like acyl-CoA dehydrogenase